MALSLTAEQKNLLKIFKIEEQYVVPAYQRPYSWEYDHCLQLYNDLLEAFKQKEDYFVGNIIITQSEDNKSILEVIDGQQRLTTLLLLIKALSILYPQLKILNQILEQENWQGTVTISRLTSEIFEASDGTELEAVLHYTSEKIKERLEQCRDKNNQIVEKKCANRFEANLLHFFNWFSYYASKNKDLEEFIRFLLQNVYLLPIALTGKNSEEANEKALVIFETINNRGMNLEDADIFKAKLYKKAKNIDEEKIFIDIWTEFKSNCEKLSIRIDDVFRYYSHLIRGKNGISSNEINLRVFFTREKYSPFEEKKYAEICDDLFTIIEILEFINHEKRQETELAKWLQVLDVYTNQYPKFALVVYLFINGLEINSQLIHFLQSLVRYVYGKGSTTTVKYEIYTIIKQICLKQAIKDYYLDIDESYFYSLGQLKVGFALLAFYLKQEKALSEYTIDRLITLKDKYLELDSDSDFFEIEFFIDDLGNFVVLDIPKKNLPFYKKNEYYQTSKLEEVNKLLINELTIEILDMRGKELRERLVNFFKGTNE